MITPCYPHPIQSNPVYKLSVKYQKNWIMVARWLNTNEMLSNADIKRPLKYITLVFELTSSNCKTRLIFTKPAWFLYYIKNITHSPQSNPIHGCIQFVFNSGTHYLLPVFTGRVHGRRSSVPENTARKHETAYLHSITDTIVFKRKLKTELFRH